MKKNVPFKDSVVKSIVPFAKEVLKDWLKYFIALFFSLFLVLLIYLISGNLIGWVKDENIINYIRQNIIKRDTKYQIEKVNFRWIGDDSILIFAYENISNFSDQESGEVRQKTYPWMYIFSKADNQFNLTKLVYWDNFYKKELQFELLPTIWNEYFATGSFDNFKFNLINKLKFWTQDIILFSITQDWFTFSNTYKYYWLLKYNFNSWSLKIEPLFKEEEISNNIELIDKEYLSSECLKFAESNKDINVDCLNLFKINEPELVRSYFNDQEKWINLTYDSLFWWYWKTFISDNWKNITRIKSLYWFTDNSCFQCDHDLLVAKYEFYNWEYSLLDSYLIRKNDKNYWNKLSSIID